MERDCESELSKLNIEQNACIYHFGASVIHGQRSNILRLRLDGVTSPYPRENIIAGNYILADMQAYLDKSHGQQNNEILIRHSSGIGECFFCFQIFS